MKIIDIVGYILLNYPKYKLNDLSKGRLNKIVYLIDWKSSIENQKLISPIDWVYNQYGPYVTDIEKAIRDDGRVSIETTRSYFNQRKYLVILNNKNVIFNQPNEQDKKIIDFVINTTKDYSWTKFINLVCLTYPIKVSQKGTILDLVNLAKKYKSA
jgi:hypothetical protein